MTRLTREQAAVKIDIDGQYEPPPWEIARKLRRAGYKPVAVSFLSSPSGLGRHIIVHVTPRPSSPFEVVALALLLGSDPNREAMQLFRARGFHDAPRFMKDAWNVLYQPHPQRARHLHLPE